MVVRKPCKMRRESGCNTVLKYVAGKNARIALLPLMVICYAPAAYSASLNLAGNISYNYMSTTPSSGDTTSTQYITGALSGGSYIWQPWFVVWGGSLALSQTTSGSTQSNTGTGDINLNILPRSRFPLDLGYSVTNSSVQSPSTDASPFGYGVNTRSQQFKIRESYTSYGGMNLNAWYNMAQWSTDSASQNDVTTDSMGMWLGQRLTDQNLQFTANSFTTKTEGTGRSNNSTTMTMNHDFAPGPEFSVNTLVSKVDTKNTDIKTTESSNLNASSNFYWRPDYRPLSMSGGVRFGESSLASGKNQDVNVFIGGSYTLSRSLRANANVTGSMRESAGGGRTASSTQSLGLNYSGDTIYLGKIAYHWSAGGNASNQVNTGTSNVPDALTVSGNFSHDGQRSWSLSERSRINFSLGQGVNLAENFNTSILTKGLSHSARLGWNTSDDESTTSSWLSFTDSRTISDPVTGTQMASAQFSRTQNVSRLSSLQGNLNLTASRPIGGSFTKTAGGNAEYQHSRLFGIYSLRFRSTLDLSRASSFEGSSNLTSRWTNRLDYSLGMMVASLSLNFLRSSKGSSAQNLMFMVTRRF